jgi:hypothetical protein
MIFLRFIYLPGGKRIPVYALRRRRSADIWKAVRDEWAAASGCAGAERAQEGRRAA